MRKWHFSQQGREPRNDDAARLSGIWHRYTLTRLIFVAGREACCVQLLSRRAERCSIHLLGFEILRELTRCFIEREKLGKKMHFASPSFLYDSFFFPRYRKHSSKVFFRGPLRRHFAIFRTIRKTFND